ncbi:hypothetical protein [Actinomadura rudentiformis]|uniref:Uncharacterized protein n=1 Tax=Actinomadura rudentiformis TaxID=359158 RepID=A0A6H9Z390_9ACTN|nr:hypothetical protein [Actinomadura rudentiformis]KAB2347820.1 hypothetical protein F8566_18175 [Actinomadura rudentiformis]
MAQPPPQEGRPPEQGPAPYPGFEDNVHAQYDRQVQQRAEWAATAQAGQPVQRVNPLDVMRGRIDVPGLSPESQAAHAQAQRKLKQRFIALGAFFGILLLIGVAALAGMLM